MGGRGRLGGPAGRRDRASDRRRKLADLHYDGSAPSACALISGTSASLPLPFSNGLDPRRSKQTAACGRSVRLRPCRWRSEGPRGRGSAGTKVWTVFYRNARADRLPPYALALQAVRPLLVLLTRYTEKVSLGDRVKVYSEYAGRRVGRERGVRGGDPREPAERCGTCRDDGAPPPPRKVSGQRVIFARCRPIVGQ